MNICHEYGKKFSAKSSHLVTFWRLLPFIVRSVRAKFFLSAKIVLFPLFGASPSARHFWALSSDVRQIKSFERYFSNYLRTVMAGARDFFSIHWVPVCFRPLFKAISTLFDRSLFYCQNFWPTDEKAGSWDRFWSRKSRSLMGVKAELKFRILAKTKPLV